MTQLSSSRLIVGFGTADASGYKRFDSTVLQQPHSRPVLQRVMAVGAEGQNAYRCDHWINPGISPGQSGACLKR